MMNQDQCLRIAIEGCGHGALDDIYASVEHAAKLQNWESVDLLIICGDFQAIRNAQELNTMSAPYKYRSMQDFHKYYSGELKAPYLTIFIGGNHEASAYCRELYHGGWVAPNIYYLGAANILRLGSLRIAGLSGIYKYHDYRKPHHERLPFSQDDVKSIYHVRELDVRKLLSVQTQVDIGLSHDWPAGIELLGDSDTLFRHKPYFKADSDTGRLGSKPATYVIDHLRPPYWFSAHMHEKFVAIKTFELHKSASVIHSEAIIRNENEAGLVSTTLKDIKPPVINTDEISLDIDEDVTITPSPKNDQIPLDLEDSNSNYDPKHTFLSDGKLAENIIDQLPESFKYASTTHKHQFLPHISPFPHPTAIDNHTVRFLALDKILPNREFLQLMEITPVNPTTLQRPLTLSYDPEWLAITRAYGTVNPTTNTPPPPTDTLAEINAQRRWIDDNVPDLAVPLDFTVTAPVYDASVGSDVPDMPREYSNPQTDAFCKLVGIRNFFHASEEEQLRRERLAPAETRGIQKGSSHGGGGGRGDGAGNSSYRGNAHGRGMRGGFRGTSGSSHRGRGRGQGRTQGRGGRFW